METTTLLPNTAPHENKDDFFTLLADEYQRDTKSFLSKMEALGRRSPGAVAGIKAAIRATSTPSLAFLNAWKEAVQARAAHLKEVWRDRKRYTDAILGGEVPLVSNVADKLGLKCYPSDYYSLDAVFYRDQDRVQFTPPHQYWFRGSEVAFEHEKDFISGLFQEVAHLLLTNARLRVLVAYPNSKMEQELSHLHSVIAGSWDAREISDREDFLLIFGYEHGFQWEGRVFKVSGWKMIE